MRIIHHTDMDGLCAGAIVYNYFNMHRMDDTNFCANLDGIGDFVIDFAKDSKISTYASGYKFNERDGRYDHVLYNELFVFVDLSISNANIDIIKKLSDAGAIIIWLDHHKSSLDYLDEVRGLDGFHYLIDIERSGALLAYDVFFRRKAIRNMLVDEACKLEDKDDRDYYRSLIEDTIIYPQYVDDYDRWQFKLNRSECKYTECFASGFMSAIEGNDVTSRFHTRLLQTALSQELRNFDFALCNHCSNKGDYICERCKEYYEAEYNEEDKNPEFCLKDDGSDFVSSYNFLCKMRDNMTILSYDGVDIYDDKVIRAGYMGERFVSHAFDQDLVCKLMTDGLAILRYEDSINDRMYKAYGQRHSIDLTVTPDNDNVTFEAAVINRSCNSKIFGYDYDKYPVCICYQYTGYEYKYTLYSNSKFNFDCSKIAELFGGGGHAGAAGFTTSQNLFEGDGRKVISTFGGRTITIDTRLIKPE